MRNGSEEERRAHLILGLWQELGVSSQLVLGHFLSILIESLSFFSAMSLL